MAGARRVSIAPVILIVGLALVGSACSGMTPRERARESLRTGLAAHRDGGLEEAQGLYLETLGIESRNKYALYNLGLIAHVRHQRVAAERAYRRALLVDPAFADALFNLAVLRSDLGATMEAIDLYESVTVLEPRNAAAHLNLGLLLRSAGRPRVANEQIARALDLNPDLAASSQPAPEEPESP